MPGLGEGELGAWCEKYGSSTRATLTSPQAPIFLSSLLVQCSCCLCYWVLVFCKRCSSEQEPWTALTRAGYWLPARMLGPKYQIPHLQVAPNLPSGVTKKVHNMPTSKSITILSDNHRKLDPRYDIAFQMPRGWRGSVCCRPVIPCHQRVPHRWNSSWCVDFKQWRTQKHRLKILCEKSPMKFVFFVQ